MAWGWSPLAAKSDTIVKRLPPSVLPIFRRITGPVRGFSLFIALAVLFLCLNMGIRGEEGKLSLAWEMQFSYCGAEFNRLLLLILRKGKYRGIYR